MYLVTRTIRREYAVRYYKQHKSMNMIENKFVYHDITDFMIRTPMFSNNEYKNFLCCKNIEEMDEYIKKICKYSEFREAILVASENLYNKIDSFLKGEILSNKKLEDFKISILKYYIRMCTRTTPFGLFSCVGKGTLSDHFSEKHLVNNRKKVARPDFEWLMKLIKKLESENFKQLSYILNSGIFKKGDRICLPYTTDTENSDINLRKSKPVKIIVDLCTNKKRSYTFLESYLHNEYPEVSQDVLEGMIKELVNQEIIISNLRSPLSNNEFAYLLAELKKIPQFDNKREELEEIYAYIEGYNTLEIGKGEEVLKIIVNKMKELISSTTYLQIDAVSTIAQYSFDESMLKDVKEVVNFVFNTTKMIFNKETVFDEYRMDFIERFGEDREVSLCEMLDNDIGIGAPYSYMHPYAARNRRRPDPGEVHKHASDYLWRKYESAIQRGEPIVLEDDIVSLDISVDQSMRKTLPTSIELNFILKREKEKTVFYLGPNIGSTGAGKTFGRFTHLDGSYVDLCNRVNKAEKECVDNNTIICELSYIPQKIRLANVVRNANNRDYEIALYLNGSKEKEKQITIDDIYVGLEKGKFYLKSKSLDKKIIVKTNNMLNITGDSNLIRFIKEIEQDGLEEWCDFIWQRVFRNLPHIPEIRYKNFILSLETWEVSKSQFDYFSHYQLFTKEFEQYKRKNNIPRFVYIADADNRLKIDLLNAYGIKIVQKSLKKLHTIKLIACESGEDIIYDELGNKYDCEVVIPLVKDGQDDFINNMNNKKSSEKIVLIDANERLKMLGSDWLYLKLYGAGAWQENLIIYYLSQFTNNMLSERKIDKYFFMRYADPEFHIRVRLHSSEMINHIVEISRWLGNLREQELITRFEIGCYDREIERYGGIQGIKIAEEIFFADSQIAQKLLLLQKEEGLEFEKEMTGVISAIFYMEQFGWDFESQLRWLNSFVQKDDFKTEYLKVRKEYESVCNSDNNWLQLLVKKKGNLLIELFNSRKNSVQKYREAINQNLITTSEDIILGSLIHLSFNRLFGIDREFERKILSFTRHTLYSLRYLRGNKNEEKS